MVTFHREAGMRFVIFVDDHGPAHVHVYGDGTAKINLTGLRGEPELVHSRGMNDGDLRKAINVVETRQDYLLKCWREIHG